MFKKFFTLAAMVISMAVLSYAQSGDYEAFMKERESVSKYSKEQLTRKVSKDARKEAKAYSREGWKTAPGSLPMERQLDKVYMMQYEFDAETGFPKYISGGGQSTGSNYDAARMQAVNLAKIELAGNIATEICALIESRVANNQLEAGQAVSGSESVMGAKNIIAQNIGRTITVLELYRELTDKNKEVRVMIFYNADMAKADAKKAMREEMENRADALVEQIDGILGF